MSSAKVAPKKRLGHIDLVRVVAVLFVVSGHVWSNLPFPGHVYIFMIISGYLWTDGRDLLEETKRKAEILLRPYLAWGILLLLVLLVQLIFFTDISPKQIILTVLSVIWGGEKAKAPFTSFWYFTALFFTGIFYRYLRDKGGAIYIVGVALSAISTFTINELLSELPLGIGVGFSCVVFFALGHLWRTIESKVSFAWYIYLVALVITAYLDLSGTIGHMVVKSGYFGTPMLSILNSALLTFSLINLAPYVYGILSGKAKRAIREFVLLVTPVILLHPVPIWVWYNLGWTPKDDLSKIILFFTCIVFSLGAGIFARIIIPHPLKSWFIPGSQNYKKKH